MNRIIVPHTKKTLLQRAFNTSHVTVRKALNGDCKTTSVISMLIRQAALNQYYGGVEVQPIEENNVQILTDNTEI